MKRVPSDRSEITPTFHFESADDPGEKLQKIKTATNPKPEPRAVPELIPDGKHPRIYANPELEIKYMSVKRNIQKLENLLGIFQFHLRRTRQGRGGRGG